MTISSVKFHLRDHNDENIPYQYDRSRLKLGAAVYIKFDETGKPIEFSPDIKPSFIPYYIMWISPSEWFVDLKEKFTIEEPYKEHVFSIVNEYIDKETVFTALENATHDVRPEHMYKTSEMNNGRLAVVSTVIERLNLCSILLTPTIAKELHLQCSPLVVFLLLTCFDRLGQPSDWIDFGSWLRKMEKMKITKLIQKEKVQPVSPITLYENYTHIYGVSRSFYRFIHEILPDQTRQELLDSMWIEIDDNPPDLGKNRKADNIEKERFLFKLRNDYTHKAQYIPGMLKSNWPTDRLYEESWIAVHQVINSSTWSTLFVKNWPGTIEKVVRVGLANYLTRMVTE